jgi:hypothetical protein
MLARQSDLKMKLARESGTPKGSLIDRLSGAFDGVRTRFGLGKERGEAAARARYLAAIDASPITAEQRKRAMENAATSVDIEAALDDADRAHERYLKEQESRVRRGGHTSGHRRAE